MSARCSICRHPLRDSINVSLLRDGTRSTARQFQVSRPALDRHKRHVRTSVPIQARAAGVQTADFVARPDGTHSRLSELDVLMRRCEEALIQETASGDFGQVLRVIKELRSCLELRVKLEAQKSRDVFAGLGKGFPYSSVFRKSSRRPGMGVSVPSSFLRTKLEI
jgi:hypothetical protein